MLCPLLSRHQPDPATGKAEWIHQECLGAQCQFYSIPEADCQFLIASRAGNIALPTAVTTENLSASAALGVTAGREVAGQIETALRQGLERLDKRQEEAAAALRSAHEESRRRLESEQSAAAAGMKAAFQEVLERLEAERAAGIKQLQSNREEKDSRLRRIEERLEKLDERHDKALEALTRLDARADEEARRREEGGKALGETRERLRALGEGQQETLRTLQAMQDAVTSLPSRHEALSERLQSSLEESLRAQTEAVGSRLGEELKAAGSEQNRQLEALAEAGVRNNGRLLQELKRSEQTQEETLATLRSDVEKVAEAAGESKQALESLSAVLAEVRAGVEKAPAEIQGVSKQTRDLHQFTRDALDAARQRAEGLWSQVETVGRSIGQLALIIKGMQNEVERANAALGAVRTENKSLLLAFHEQKTTAHEEQRRRNIEQARELNNKGVALFHRGSLEAAVEAFIRAAELKPDFAEAYNNLGLAYSRRGQSEDAVRYFQKALEIDPQMGEVYNNLGFLFHTSARYERAVEMFTRSLQSGADQAIAYTNLGNTFYKMKQNDKAVVAWKKALEIDPLNESARRGLAMFQQEPSGPAAAKA